MEALYTIGYEGAALEHFIRTLRRHHIDHVLDIRERASSRRQGFAKTALRTALGSAGIDYRHERALGSPTALRERLRRDGNYATYFAGFERHLAGQDELLRTLARQLSGRVALLCYERDARRCHRRSVARALARLTGLRPRDLVVDDND